MVFRRLWRTLVNRLQAQGRTTARPQRGRLRVEALEDRLVPTIWYVSTLGADVVGGGGTANPFRNIQFAVNQAVSGDNILVATGTYGYDAASTDSVAAFLRVSAVVLDADKSLSFFGGFNNNFTARSASTPTIIDGGNIRRDMLALAANSPISLSMDQFTLQNGAARGETLLSAPDNVFAFGGGLWINTAAQSATSGPFNLSNMNFQNNSAIGSNTGGAGGAGAGGALELRQAKNVNLQNVTFTGNVAAGGTGTTAGGQGIGGAIQADHSSVTGNNVTFTNNRALAGAASGNGQGSNGTADALGGAVAIQISSSGTFANVTATGNQAVGGGAAAGLGGAGFGGGLYAEDATLSVTDGTVTGNTLTSGAGQTSGNAVGGGIAVFNGSSSANSGLTLNRVKVIGNAVREGNATGNAGSPGGGGVYVTANGGSAPTAITNSVIADNTVNFGSGNTSVGGGGGGIWIQGLTATITQSTIANNQLGAGLNVGAGLWVLTNTVPGQSVANVLYTIIANNTGPTSATTAVEANRFDQAGRSVVNFTQSMYANNQTNDDSSQAPTSFTGLNTMVNAAVAGFISAGAPAEDYRLLAGSAAVNAATGSTATVDLNNFPRTAPPDIGAFELGSVPSSPPPVSPPPPPPSAGLARSSPGAFDPTTGNWYLRNENGPGGPDAGQFAYGAAGWIPVVGDWDGNGTQTVGVFDPNTATWYLRNSNSPGGPSITPFQFGGAGWKPVVGDWDGNGTTTIGVVDPNGIWYLRNTNAPGGPDIKPFAYGLGSWTPVAGSWNGTKAFGIGMFDPTTGNWYLRSTAAAGAPDAGNFAYGGAGFQPIVGDWNNDGKTTIGVFDPNGNWYLRNANSAGGPDISPFAYGAGNWIPVAGDYDGLPSTGAARVLDGGLTATPPDNHSNVLDVLFGQA